MTFQSRKPLFVLAHSFHILFYLYNIYHDTGVRDKDDLQWARRGVEPKAAVWKAITLATDLAIHSVKLIWWRIVSFGYEMMS